MTSTASAKRKYKKKVKPTKKLLRYICDELEKGKTLTDICTGDEMPAHRTVHKWVREDDEFAKDYRQARETQMNFWIDQMNHIADMPPPIAPSEVKNDQGEMVTLSDGEKKLWVNAEVQRRRLKVDTIKFQSAKIAGTMGYHQQTGVTVVGDTINIVNYATQPEEAPIDVGPANEVKVVNFIDTTEETNA